MAANRQKSYTCVIIDDESPAHKALSFHIASYSQLTLVGRAFNAVEGLKLVERLKPGVIFLNVTMPYMTGLEMLDHFSTHDHYIILTSALETRTVRDKRVNDYLLVPVTTSRFLEAVQRLEMNI
ncbi:LytR/AlgR family response regulator transcription factor [Dyadobacter psychrotolerans]|uniref:Response regulator n=1 Tax=Dyadobacter psychrotolerans TaxID=2541721 RepID=A0A4V2Z412_9BACT|nr:response regulator [Dyadobacter psychrotolerans]TDE14738.1 response regulator [Dyadobacter psychrotolerans]